MEHIIRSGESVMIHGKVITRVEDLPSETDLAAGDTVRLDAEEARLNAEIAQRAAELETVRKRREQAERATAEAAEAGDDEDHDDAPKKRGRKARAKADETGNATPDETPPSE
jgi:hypothetical protein